MHVRPSSWYSWPPLLLDYPIPQHPDGLNLQLDDVTGAQVASPLQLVVQLPRLQRPREVLIRPYDCPVVAFVIAGRRVPSRRDGLAALLGRGGDVLLEGDEVTERRRVRERGQ